MAKGKKPSGEEDAGPVFRSIWSTRLSINQEKKEMLEDRIRWMSFLYRAWKPHYLAAIRDIFGELDATASEFSKIKNRIMTGISSHKQSNLRRYEWHVKKQRAKTPLLGAMSNEDVHQHFSNSYNSKNFFYVWSPMRGRIDVENSSDLAQCYCKSLYVNLCVEVKKWLDAKDSGEPDDVARGELLSFYDVVTTHPDFDGITKDDFKVIDDRVRNERPPPEKIPKTSVRPSPRKRRETSVGPPPKKIRETRPPPRKRRETSVEPPPKKIRETRPPPKKRRETSQSPDPLAL